MDININTLGFATFIGVIATIVFTILAYKHIIPEKKRAGLNKLGQFLHDVFNFKFLIIEKVLQFFYVLATIACVCCGLAMVLGFTAYGWGDRVYTDWYGIYGILTAIIGPFAIRLAYEMIIMGLLLVKNVMQINKKLKNQTEDEEEAYHAPSIKELVNKENFAFISQKKADENTNEQ